MCRASEAHASSPRRVPSGYERMPDRSWRHPTGACSPRGTAAPLVLADGSRRSGDRRPAPERIAGVDDRGAAVERRMITSNGSTTDWPVLVPSPTRLSIMISAARRPISYAGCAATVRNGSLTHSVGEVVEGDDRDVVGHPQAHLAQCADGPERDEVVGGEQGRRRVVGRGQDALRHLVPIGEVAVPEVEAAPADERLVQRRDRPPRAHGARLRRGRQRSKSRAVRSARRSAGGRAR